MAKNLVGAVTAALLLVGCALAAADDNCQYGGSMYSDGAAICQTGSQYRCSDGAWKSLGLACAAEQVAAGRACDYGGSGNYSNGAVICQAGSQHRCENGSWKALGFACTAAGDMPRVSGDMPRPRSCVSGGRTFSDRATICQDGFEFRCDSGTWRNLGTTPLAFGEN